MFLTKYCEITQFRHKSDVTKILRLVIWLQMTCALTSDLSAAHPKFCELHVDVEVRSTSVGLHQPAHLVLHLGRAESRSLGWGHPQWQPSRHLWPVNTNKH